MSNPESEPIITVNFENGSIELPRSLTSIYTFLGRAALDHIFLEESSDGQKHLGSYLFRDKITDDGFNAVHKAAAQFNFEMHLNLPEVPESDMEAYIAAHSEDMLGWDGVPGDWV